MSEIFGISFTREPVPQCWLCKHFEHHSFRPHCTAFPKDIPSEIWNNAYDHREPYPNDNGIQAEFLDIETLGTIYGGSTDEQIKWEIRKVTATLDVVKPHF